MEFIKKQDTMNCPYCNLQENEVYSLSENYKLILCKSCGFIWKNEVFKNDYYQELKRNYYYIHNEVNLYERRKKFIKRFITFTNSLNVLDFGGGDGYFLHKFDENINKYNVELSDYGRKISSENYSIKSYKSILDIPNNIEFDLVLLYDVLEHISDFHEVFIQIKSRLKVDGYIVIETGITDSFLVKIFKEKWKYFHTDEHLSFFNRELIKKLFGDGYSFVGGEIINRDINVNIALLKKIIKVCLACLIKKWGKIYIPLFYDHYQIIVRKNI
jgi:SAM-dependent methyltransferase